jgi:hypothetical protein
MIRLYKNSEKKMDGFLENLPDVSDISDRVRRTFADVQGHTSWYLDTPIIPCFSTLNQYVNERPNFRDHSSSAPLQASLVALLSGSQRWKMEDGLYLILTFKLKSIRGLPGLALHT